MKLALLSDVHLTDINPVCRKDNLVDIQWDKLSFILNYCRSNNIAAILQAGDLTDRPRSFPIVYRLMDLISFYEEVYWFVVWGQHDQYLRSTDVPTNFGILKNLSNFKIIRNYFSEGAEDFKIYGAGWGETVPNIDCKSKCRILITHSPITDRQEDMDYTEHIKGTAFQLLKSTKFDLILCGDIHKSFITEHKGRYIVNTGPMLRRNVDDIDHAPHFLIYDTDAKSIERIDIPHSQAGEVISREHIDSAKENKALLDDFINNISSEGISDIDIIENLNQFIEKNEIEDPVIDILEQIVFKEEVND